MAFLCVHSHSPGDIVRKTIATEKENESWQETFPPTLISASEQPSASQPYSAGRCHPQLRLFPAPTTRARRAERREAGEASIGRATAEARQAALEGAGGTTLLASLFSYPSESSARNLWN